MEWGYICTSSLIERETDYGVKRVKKVEIDGRKEFKRRKKNRR